LNDNQEDNQMAKKSTENVNGSGTTINVKGGIHAGHDVVMGSQQNVYYQQVQTPAQFLAELQTVQAQLGALKQQPALPEGQAATIEIVEGQVTEVVEEVQKPQPRSAVIVAKLNAAKAVLDSLSGTLGSGMDLVGKITLLAALAGKLFGG
jgi:hypothetical protein